MAEALDRNMQGRCESRQEGHAPGSQAAWRPTRSFTPTGPPQLAPDFVQLPLLRRARMVVQVARNRSA